MEHRNREEIVENQSLLDLELEMFSLVLANRAIDSRHRATNIFVVVHVAKQRVHQR